VSKIFNDLVDFRDECVIKEKLPKEDFLKFVDLLLANFDIFSTAIDSLNEYIHNHINDLQENKSKEARKEEKTIQVPEGYILISQFMKKNELCRRLSLSASRLRNMMLQIEPKLFEDIVFVMPDREYHTKYFVDPTQLEDRLLKYDFRNALEKQAVKQYKKELKVGS